MAQSEYTVDSASELSAAKAIIDEKTAMEIAGAERVAATREAIYLKSETRILDQQQKDAEKNHKAEISKMQKELKATLARLRKEGAEETKLKEAKKKANAEIAEKKKQYDQESAARQKKIAKSKQEDEKKLISIIQTYSKKQYEEATLAEKKLYNQRILDHARAAVKEKKEAADAAKIRERAIKDDIKNLEKKAATSGGLSEEEQKALEEQKQALADIQEIKKKLQAEGRAAAKAEADAQARKVELDRTSFRLEQQSFKHSLNGLKQSEKLKAIDAQRQAIQKKLQEGEKKIQELRNAAAAEQNDEARKKIEAEIAQLEVELDAPELRQAMNDLDAAFKESKKPVKGDTRKAQAKEGAAQIQKERDIEKAENREKVDAQWANFTSKEGMKDEGSKAVANSVKALSNQLTQITKTIDTNINQFYAYQASVEARLQGSDESYKKALKTVSKNIGASMLVSQKDMIENIKKATESGIAQNLELRAFLATVSDSIATTFDAFDGNLLRLIRMQQADTTAARMGMEASLTKLFNEYFADTNYLTNAFDTVSQNLIDANAQLTRDASLEFEYIVQKWLGALYSVGFSDNAISTISQGLGYLATGNVEALNGNDALNSLLAMSASRAGKSYADILTGGLDAKITNDLLKSMVEYLQSIAENTDNNQVTKSAYANLFGMSMGDLASITNLTAQDLTNLHSESLTYSQSMNELNSQLNEVSSRVHASSKLDTMFENAIMSASTAIGNNIGVYGLWKTLNIIEGLTGGINIPAIGVMGNMVDLDTTIIGLAKIGIAGLPLMGSLLGTIFSGGMNNLGKVGASGSGAKWTFDEYTSRGGSRKAISMGSAYGTSSSSEMSMTGSSSSDDVKQSSMGEGTSGAEEDSKTTNQSVADQSEEGGKALEQIRDAVSNGDLTVVGLLSEIKTLIREDRKFMIDLGLSPDKPLPIVPVEGTEVSTFTTIFGSALTSKALNTITTLNPFSLEAVTTDIAGNIQKTTITMTNSVQSGGSTATNTIGNLESQNIVNANTSDSSISTTTGNTSTKVELSALSDGAKTVFQDAVKTAVSSAFGLEGNQEAADSIIAAIIAELQSQTLKVEVTNDNFDEALQKVWAP